MLAASHSIDATALYNAVYIVIGLLALVKTVKEIITWRDRRHERNGKLDELLKRTASNGLESDNVGDVAKRIEYGQDLLIKNQATIQAALEGHFTDDASRFGKIDERLVSIDARLTSLEGAK